MPRTETPSSTGSSGLSVLYRATAADEAPAGPDDVTHLPESTAPVEGVGFSGWRWRDDDAPGARGTDSLLTPQLVAAGYHLAQVPAAAAAATPRILVMDVDSTLITQEVIEMLAAHADREGEVAAVTEAAMRGELDFAQSLHHRVAALAGLEESVISEVVDAVQPQPGARELIDAFHRAGWAVCAVSGGFSQVLGPLAHDLGLDRYRANELEIVDGRLTGSVIGPVVDRAAKAESLRAWAAEFGVSAHGTIAVGDGANDIDMLQAAGLGVAYCAKPALREHAHVQVDVPSLDVVRVLAGL